MLNIQWKFSGRVGVSSCVNSYGGEVETFAQHIIKANTIDTLKFLNDESSNFEIDFPRKLPAWPTLMLLRRIRVRLLIRLFPKKKLAASAFRPATEAVRIRSFSTHPKPNGYGSTRRTGMFWFIFIRLWYQYEEDGSRRYRPGSVNRPQTAKRFGVAARRDTAATQNHPTPFRLSWRWLCAIRL
jgi:hypothetical protein